MAPRRGRRGAGSVYWHASRRQWRARLRWTDRLTGRAHERELAAPTREEARRLLAELRRLRDEGRLADPAADRRLGDHVAAWLEAKRTHGLAWHSMDRYARFARGTVLPLLGERTRLRAITPQDCNRLYRALLARGQKPATVLLAHETLHNLFSLAVKWGHLERNPCDRADPPRRGATERPLLAPQEARKLLDTAREAHDPLWPLWTLAAHTGLRVGEACALRWDDLTLPGDGSWGTVRVDETLLAATVARGVVTGPPKSKSGRRTLPLHPAAVGALRTLPRQAPRAFVFTRAPDGRLPLTGSLAAERLQAACRRAGIARRVTFHSFRRYVASEGLAGSGDLPGAAGVLGHARGSALSVTVDVYAQAREGAAKAMLAAVGRTLEAAAGGHQ